MKILNILEVIAAVGADYLAEDGGANWRFTNWLNELEVIKNERNDL